MNRRDLLKWIGVTPLLASLPKAKAKPIVYRGPGAAARYPASVAADPVQDAFLANLVLQNTTGSSTPSASYISFGQAFRRGDVPTGAVPQLRTQTGTVLPTQFDLRNTWPDGSLRWCEVSCVAPSIAASAFLPVNVSAVSGTYDNAARRNVSEIAGAGCNPTVAITNCTDYLGATFMSGAQNATFSAAVAQGGIFLEPIKSGPICDQWKAWMFFPGQPSGGEQLAAFFYVTAWTNQNNGALATISHICKVHNGWLSKTGAGNFNYDAAYSDGLSTSRTWSSNKTFAWSSGTQFTCATHGRQNGDAVTVTSVGTLPTGLSSATGQTYWISVINANTVGFAPFISSMQGGVNFGTDAGTGGPHMFHWRIYHTHHTGWFTCDVDGLSDWTSSEATIFVAQDVGYLHSTGMLPPVDLSVQEECYSTNRPAYVDPTLPWDYHPMSPGRYSGDIDGGGSNVDMKGWMCQWDLRAFKNQRHDQAKDFPGLWHYVLRTFQSII